MRFLALAPMMLVLAAATSSAHADQPGADWMKSDQVIEKLTAKGYTNFSKVEADDGIGSWKPISRASVTIFMSIRRVAKSPRANRTTTDPHFRTAIKKPRTSGAFS